MRAVKCTAIDERRWNSDGAVRLNDTLVKNALRIYNSWPNKLLATIAAIHL